MTSPTSRAQERKPLPDQEIRRRLLRLYDMALTAAERVDNLSDCAKEPSPKADSLLAVTLEAALVEPPE